MPLRLAVEKDLGRFEKTSKGLSVFLYDNEQSKGKLREYKKREYISYLHSEDGHSFNHG